MALLPESESTYLKEKGFEFEEVSEGGQIAVVIRGMPVSEALYGVTATDILILVPPGFPDVPPDMFYAFPWLKLTSTGAYPRAADVPHNFDGRSWQRWSRHNAEWRPGKDGIATFLKRVSHALENSL
jgi:hypothetical protein